MIRRFRAIGWRRTAILVGLAAAGAGAGTAWGWASPLPVQRTFEVEARQFAYDPGILRANRGDHVVIRVRSTDVTHGLYVDGYDVVGKAVPGGDLTLEFDADRTGRFSLRCSEVCGVFHPFMTGQLVVEPNLLLPGSIGAAGGLAVASALFAGWTARREEEA